MAPLPIHWPACPTHATNQEAEYPTSCSSRSACNDWEPQQQKVRGKKHPKNLKSICMRFKMYASSRQLLMQTPIRLSYFSMPVSRTKQLKIEQIPMHGLVIVQSLLVNGVVRNISTLKVVDDEFAHRLQALHPVISDLFLEDSAHDVSSEIRRHRGAFPNKCGHEAKSRCKQVDQSQRGD